MNAGDIQKLREETGAGIMECKRALEEAKGDFGKAKEILKERGALIAQKKSERVAGEGVIESYIHSNGKIGALVEINAETDFVARNPEFKEFAHDIAMQIASMDPKDVEGLLEQSFIKDQSLTIRDLLHQKIAKIGENIQIKRFVRYNLS